MLRGEIYRIDLGAGAGREFVGPNLVAVISSDFVNSLGWTVIVVPGLDAVGAKRQFAGVRVTAAESGMPTDLTFYSLQVRAVDHGRFSDPPLGRVPEAVVKKLIADLLSNLTP